MARNWTKRWAKTKLDSANLIAEELIPTSSPAESPMRPL
jgi:hypothetical protein